MSKLGALGRFIGTLISWKMTISQYFAMVACLGFMVYAIGDYTREFVKDKKTILDLIYWRDPKRSGIALGTSLIVLYLIAHYNWITLLSGLSLLVLAGTIGFRVFRLVEAHIKKTDATNPFHDYLHKEIEIPEEKIHAHVNTLVEHGHKAIIKLRSFVFVENLYESIKFGLLLYTLYYVGGYFSGFTLITFFVLGLFIVPKVYEQNQEPIDKHIDIAKDHWKNFNHTLGEKVPFLKPDNPIPEAEKKEE